MPKGEPDGDGEDLLAVAIREEELGSPPPRGEYIQLGVLKQPSGKRIAAFALAGDFNSENITSNTFELEWSRGSGKIGTYPEIDRAACRGLRRCGGGELTLGCGSARTGHPSTPTIFSGNWPSLRLRKGSRMRVSGPP